MRWILVFLCFLLQSLNIVEGQHKFFPFIENGEIGFKDEMDSVWITPVYDFYEISEEAQGWTAVGVGKYERLNNNATERQVRFTGKFGFVGDSAREVFSPQFDMFFQVYEDHAIVGMGDGALIYNNWPEGKSTTFEGRIGVINRAGHIAVPVRFHEIARIRSKNNPYWFVLDEQGKSSLYLDSMQLPVPENISEFCDFSSGLARIKIDQKFGFIDTTGQVVVEPVFDQAKDYSGDKAFVLKAGRYVWIDKSGNEIQKEKSIIFDEVGNFSEGYARVRVFDNYGFIHPDSSFFIWPEFIEATPFFNQISSVSKIDSFGYVYTSGMKDLVKRYEYDKITGSLNQVSKKPSIDFQGPAVDFKDTLYFFHPFDTLTLERFLSMHAEAIRWAPYLYYNYPQMLPKVSAGEGTQAGRFLFNMSFLQPGNEIWEHFKHNVLLKLLAEEKSRSILWKFFKPFYRLSFRSMPEIHQQVYLDMVNYLEDYFEDYDIVKTRAFLQNNETFFAHEHVDGSRSPFRKASAQIDRLILIYEVISVEDTQKWIRKINKDMSKW